jgi:flagellin
MAARLLVRTVALVGSLNIAAVSATQGCNWCLGCFDAAIADVDNYRATLGATANRLEHSANNLYTRVENQMAAKSRIEDADYAVESANLARAQVLQQAGTAMLAQANASTQNVLSLLK